MYLREINTRRLYYQRYSNDGAWTIGGGVTERMHYIIVHAPTNDVKYLTRIADQVVAYLPAWAGAVGEHCELLHDIIDEVWVWKNVKAEEIGQALPLVMTTWQADIAEELWFACYAANDDEMEIKNILYIDASEMTIGQVENLLPE